MLPLISISLPTLNEETYLKLCLDSIKRLDYPRNRLEVFVIDAGSTDNTLKIARKYSFVKIINNPEKDTHIAKMLGLMAAKGKYWTYFDADLQVNGKAWAKAMIKPLENDTKVTASVSKYHGRENDSAIEKYINLDPVGRDTLFAWFTPSIQSTITKKINNYYICRYDIGNIPPEGRCLFRTKQLKKLLKNMKRFRELDTLFLLTKANNTKYAYVPNPGYYHRHPQSISELRKKRKRNTQKNYIPGNKEGIVEYTWFDLSNPRDMFKMTLLVLYAFSIVGPLFGGIYKSLKNKSRYGLVEIIYVPVAVEAYLEAFIISKEGIKFIFKNIKELFSKITS